MNIIIIIAFLKHSHQKLGLLTEIRKNYVRFFKIDMIHYEIRHNEHHFLFLNNYIHL